MIRREVTLAEKDILTIPASPEKDILMTPPTPRIPRIPVTPEEVTDTDTDTDQTSRLTLITNIELFDQFKSLSCQFIL